MLAAHHFFQNRLRLQHLFIFFLLLIGVFFTYRYGMNSLPRGDQVVFMRERELATSDWNFFWHSISYHRQTILFQGDFFLFRPFFHAYLAVVDIFFREQLAVIVSFALVLHASLCFLLYYLCYHLTKNTALAVVGAFFLLTQYAGMEMVYWTHVNGYILALIFLSLALIEILKAGDNGSIEKSWKKIALLLLISSFFHEVIVYSLLFLSMVTWLWFRKTISSKWFWMILLLPPILYFTADVIDLIRCKPLEFFFDPFDQVSRFSLSTAFHNFLFLSGIFVIAALAPSQVKILFANYLYQAEWDITNFSPRVAVPIGALLIMGLIGLLIGSLRALKQNISAQKTAITFVTALIAGYFLTLSIVLGIARVGLRTFLYMKSATYYYYFTNFLFLITVALVAGWLKNSRRPIAKFLYRFLFILAIILFGWQIPYNYASLQSMLKFRHGVERAVASTVREISKATDAKSKYCYGGSFDPAFWSALAPDYMLYRHSCFDNSKRALYAALSPKNEIWLMALNRYDNLLPNPVLLKKSDFEAVDSSIFGPPEAIELMESMPVYLTKESYRPAYYSALIDGGIVGGLVLGYQDPGNFMFISFQKNRYSLYARENGITVPISHHKSYYWNHDPFHLSVVKMNDMYMVFFNQNAVITFRSSHPIEGKAGICYLGKESEPPSFSDAVLFEDDPEGKQMVSFSPMIKLKAFKKDMVST